MALTSVKLDVVTLVDLLLAGDADSDAFHQFVDEVDDAGLTAVLALATHPAVEVRRAVTLTLPLLSHGERPSEETVAVVIGLTVDSDRQVRDYACMALGQQWREVDTPQLRDALAARLDDIDREVRCEALVGLAFRRDARAGPRVRAALSRPSGEVWRLEMVAAGALSDSGLHTLVLQLQDGWEDAECAATADAVRRLTDPDGPGVDVVDGVAELYRRRAHGLPDGETLGAWHIMDAMLDIAPDRAQGFLWAVLARLDGDLLAIAEVQSSSALAILVPPS